MTYPEIRTPEPDNAQPATRRQFWLRGPGLIAAIAAAAIALVGIAVGIGAASGGDSKASASPAAAAVPYVDPCGGGMCKTPAPTATADEGVAGNDVTMDCSTGTSLEDVGTDDSPSRSIQIMADAAGRHSFTEAWKIKAELCDVTTVNGEDTEVVTAIAPDEKAAYDASGYDDGNMATLYTICAEKAADDPYIEAGFAMSAEQITEMTGALKLCPGHPYAKKWRAAMKRGSGDAKLEAQGRIFGDGKYRVGKTVKAGTYVAKDVDGCYWERQNKSGGIIANNFVNGAIRVQVTIRSGDYGFYTRGCGTWRPA